MSWLARSLVNSLKVDDDEEQEDNNRIKSRNRESSKDDEEEEEEDQQVQIDSSEIPNRGVKEDLSDFTKTLSRQLWGVASFLAPPPPPSSILVRDSSEPLQHSPTSPSHQISSTDPSVSNSNRWESSDQSFSGEVFDEDVPDSARLAGIRSDFAEIGGKFRTGISKLSNNKAVSEISKIASTFLPFGSEEESDENYSVGHAIGVTDEVLAFARNIAMHPETWLDFPLADEEDLDDFDLSDAQHEHALAVERLAPRLAALRIELCPIHMSEGCFWKIYFVLLHSRLNKHDAELLSTPQIVEARAIWMQELQCQTKPNSDWSGRGISHPKEAVKSLRGDYNPSLFNALSETISSKAFPFEPTTPIVSKDIETEKYPISNFEMQIIDKSVIEERPFIQSKNKDTLTYSTSKILDQKYEDDGDDWLKEDQEEIGGFGGTAIPIGNEDDVSFSDLEEDDYESVSTSSKTAVRGSNSSTKEV